MEQVYDRYGNVSMPLLMFDAAEHASYLQYRNVRLDCVHRLGDLVNWTDVAARFTAVHSGRVEGSARIPRSCTPSRRLAVG